jgi:hypothetical protein
MPEKHFRWRKVYGQRAEATCGPWEQFYDFWVEPDGSLHNPHGYPEELVRAAVLRADAEKV